MEAPEGAGPMGTTVHVPLDTVQAFLDNGIRMMQSEETREMLKCVPRPGQKLIELQRAEWDNLGVDRAAGCAQLDQMDKLFPGNTELSARRDEFVHTAQRAYLQSLEDKRPTKLERKKPMPRETIVEFFDACNTKMDLPETRERLMKHLQETKQVPNQIIIDLQRDLLEVMGFERDHGCAMLSRMAQDFPDDKEMFGRFEMWRRKAQATCMGVVKTHQMNGGELPQQLFGVSPELSPLQEQARKEVDAMSPEERKTMMQQFQRKVEVYMNLPQEGKMSYLKRLSDEDKKEFAKAQVLLVSVMQAQWQQGQPSASLGRVLELLRLADMLMVGPSVMQELRRLLRNTVFTKPHAAAELQQYCAEFEVPPWLAQLAGAPSTGGVKEVAAALTPAQITELVQSVSATNDPVAVKTLDRVLQRRARLSLEHAEACAKLLAEALEARVHLQEEETVRGRKYSMKEGGRAFLDATVAFVETCPEHVVTIARAFFFPLSREQKLGSCAVAQFKDTARGLLSLVTGSELPNLLSCVVEAGRFDALEAVAALSDALARANDATQVSACRVLARLPKVPAAMTTWKLLRSVITSVVPRVCPEAQMELCDALCDLHEDLLYQLINEPLLRGACTGAQLKLCGALAQLDVRRVHSAASAAVLGCLCGDARRLLCTLLVPQVQTLKPDVQRIVLSELEEAPGEAEASESMQSLEADRGISGLDHAQLPCPVAEEEQPVPMRGFNQVHVLCLLGLAGMIGASLVPLRRVVVRKR